jgi:hypothetical protein
MCFTRSLMRVIYIFVLVGCIWGQSTQFTYQGNLQESGIAANGVYDLEFALYDSPSGGNLLGAPISRPGVNVSTGIFAALLDFGDQFPGSARYLEIRIKSPAAQSFNVLSPRQAISSSPYAVKSLNAQSATNAGSLGGVPAAQYVLTTDSRMTDARNPLPGSTNYIRNGINQQVGAYFNISGTGAANFFDATQYFIGGQRVLSATNPDNIFIGFSAGAANTGGFNSFAGSGAGAKNTSAGSNSFFGALAGYNNVAGGENSFFGANAGITNTTGSLNSFFGSAAGYGTSGSSNSFFGQTAGAGSTTGSFNSAFGRGAGSVNQGGSSNTFIGAGSNASSDNLTNATAIGANAMVSQSNSLVLGSTAAGTNVGIGTSSPTSRLHAAGSDAATIIFGNNTGSGNGVRGYSSTGIGVAGQGGTTGSGTGVFGSGLRGVEGATFSSGSGAIAVYGRAESTSGNTSALLGENKSDTGIAVFGHATNVNGSGTGVRGNAAGSGIGVHGIGYTGVFGFSTNASGRGVSGFNSDGTAVYGFSNSGLGGSFEGATGGYFLGSPISVYAATPTGRPSFLGGGSSTGSELKFTYEGVVHYSIYNSGNGNLTFANTSATTSPNTPGTPLMVIATGGNVGIGGVTSPTSKLQVNGQGRFSTVNIDSYIGGQNLSLCTTNTGVNQNLIGLCTSSMRYKTGVEYFSRGLDIVARLRPIKFRWRDSGAQDIGLAAEDVAKVEPTLTFNDANGEVNGIKYNDLSAVLVNAIKQQQQHIEAQQKQIDELRTRLHRLQARVYAKTRR